LIIEEIVNKLIIDNDNSWNGDKTRANERHELAKSRFRDYDERNKDINIQIKYGISMCEKKNGKRKIF
jgi:hypothetical protein